MEVGQILIIICITLTFIASSTRFYLRVIVKRRYELVEFALVGAVVFQIALAGQQLRVFTLLTSMEVQSHFIEAQKLFFTGTFFYLASLWSVKISINLLHIRLTKGFRIINLLATYHLYFLIGIWPFLYVFYFAACLPVNRRWALPTAEQCGPIIYAWDFWTHFGIHLITDIILCILPFPALLKVTETRLRFAICGVYSLAIVALIVTITRIVLLATNIENSIRRIMILTAFELCVCIIIGILPGISSFFTKRYVQGSSGEKFRTSRSRTAKQTKVFVPLSENSSSRVNVGDDIEPVELTKLGHVAVAFGEEGASPAASGDTIYGIEEAGIRKVTHVSVTTDGK